MKSLLAFLILVSATHSFAGAAPAPLKLQCVVIDRRCDASGAIVGERYEMGGELKAGKFVVDAQVVTKDGRFKIKGTGLIDFKGAKNPKTALTIYDSQTQSGAAAGTLGLGLPANHRSDLVYVYGAKSIDDGDDLFCHSLEGTCEFK